MSSGLCSAEFCSSQFLIAFQSPSGLPKGCLPSLSGQSPTSPVQAVRAQTEAFPAAGTGECDSSPAALPIIPPSRHIRAKLKVRQLARLPGECGHHNLRFLFVLAPIHAHKRKQPAVGTHGWPVVASAPKGKFHRVSAAVP